jgi:hypothetical protein
MTRTPQGTPSRRSGRPGCRLLKVAEFVFTDDVLAAVVTPTISDLQTEVRDAGDDGAERIRARMRGYTAFWLLMATAPVAFHAWPTRRIGEQGTADRNAFTPFALIVTAIVLCAWNFLGWWTIVAAGGGAAFAYIIHHWHGMHPTQLVIPEKGLWRAPEINQSRIPVDGNIAGLMYVVGSVGIALVGLPFVRWFFAIAIVLAVVSAVALNAWRNAHPRRSNTILFART